MSIEQLSEASGVSAATIWRSEVRRTRPNRSTAKAIASALDCSVDVILRAPSNLTCEGRDG